jgi:hypothetical protein
LTFELGWQRQDVHGQEPAAVEAPSKAEAALR